MACTGSIPSNAVEITLPADDGALRYREEIRHPALPFPKVATGTFRIGPNDRLIRSQETPEVEIFEIGQDVVWVRKAEDGEANMLPIPDQMRALFDFLRTLRSGETLVVEADQPRSVDPDGWTAEIGTFDTDGSVSVIACGERMLGYLVRTGDGIERRVLFSTGAGKSE